MPEKFSPDSETFMPEKETVKPEQSIPTEKLLLTEKGNEIIEKIHLEVVKELQRQAIELSLSMEEIKTYIKHVETVHDMSLEMVDELREKGIEISEEDKKAIEIDAYLHDSRKFVPEFAKSEDPEIVRLNALFMHGEASAEFTKKLLIDMGFSEHYAERRAQDVREHMGMPYIIMEVKMAGIKNEAIEQAWRGWEGLDEKDQDELEQELAREKIVMPWQYQKDELGIELPTSVPATVVRAADFASGGPLKDGCYDKIVRICLHWSNLEQATQEAELGFSRNIFMLKTSTNSDPELAEIEKGIGYGRFGDKQQSKIATFREFVGTRNGELAAGSREGFKDLEVRQDGGSIDIDATMRNYYKSVKEFETLNS